MNEAAQPATKSTATAAAIESDQESSGVCPFCGSAVTAPQSACTRCGMENTPVTRQATRARLGPWYVLQTRNPSAPGMRYATLLSLVAKGRITARSIVRGPTTSQFWKPATQVRGLSRHFAVCYACGGHIAPADTTCSHCERSQEPPADPDVLLDSADGAAPAGRMGPPVFRQVPPEAAALAALPSNLPAAANSDPLAVRVADSTGVVSPELTNGGEVADPTGRSMAANQPRAPMRDSADKSVNSPRSPGRSVGGGNGPRDPVEPGRRRDDDEPERPIEERILSPRDLAAAFSMNFDARTPAHRRRRNTFSLVLVSLLLVFLIAAVVVLAVPSLRTSVQYYCHQWYEALVVEQGPPTIPPPIEPPPVTPPKAADAGGTTKVNPSPAGAGMASVPGGTPAGAGMDSSPRSPTAAGPSGGALPTASAVGGTNPRSAGPAQLPGISAPPVTDPMVAPPSSTQPADRSNLPATDADYAMSKSLRNAGLDAESRGDYAAAEADYEAIEKLPREAWTPNVELLLAQVRKKLNK